MNEIIEHKCSKCNKLLSSKQSVKNHEKICKEKPKEEEKRPETNMTRIKEKLKVYSEEKQAKILELKVKNKDRGHIPFQFHLINLFPL
jgi:transcription elongation factor Elf1